MVLHTIMLPFGTKPNVPFCETNKHEEKHVTEKRRNCECRMSYKYDSGYYRTEVVTCKECQKNNVISRPTILDAHEVCKV